MGRPSREVRRQEKQLLRKSISPVISLISRCKEPRDRTLRETCVVLSEAAVEFVASVAAVAFEAATALIPFSTTIVCIRRLERKIAIAVKNRRLSGESLRLCVFRQCYEHADC